MVNHASLTSKIANHPSRCVVLSHVTRLIWSQSRVTLLILGTSKITQKLFVTLHAYWIVATIWHKLMVSHNRRREGIRIPSREEGGICLHAFVSRSQSLWYVLIKMRPNFVNSFEVSLEAMSNDMWWHVMARDGITKWCFSPGHGKNKNNRIGLSLGTFS